MLENIVDNFIKYASVYSQALKKYAGLYGKDAVYMKLPENSTEDPYLVALGKNKVSFDYANPTIKKVPTKLIIDYAEFYKRYQADTMDAIIYFSADPPIVTAGDLIMYEKTRSDILIYKIIDAVETYADIMFKVNLKLVQNKKINHEKEKNNIGVIA